MKTKGIIVLIVCVILLLSACAPPPPITTQLGNFTYEQEFMQSIDDAAATPGNIFLVVYLAPEEGISVSSDDAHEYFYGRSSAIIADKQYDMDFLVFEKIDDQFIRFGLVFEVIDNEYEETKEQPIVELILP